MCGHEEDGAGVPRVQSPHDCPVCDDCGQEYAPPAYYTFEPEWCLNADEHHTNCTGNICPDCAGPYLEPDHDGDPRRPKE